jgi:hypothetical protein
MIVRPQIILPRIGIRQITWRTNVSGPDSHQYFSHRAWFCRCRIHGVASRTLSEAALASRSFARGTLDKRREAGQPAKRAPSGMVAVGQETCFLTFQNSILGHVHANGEAPFCMQAFLSMW